MQVSKFRVADENGFVPAGRYFEKLAANLNAANDDVAARREREEARERKLEERYRRASAARANTYAHREVQLAM